MSEIFSHGKLMLTSEYFAVDGALVLAVPTKLGQEFFFEEYNNNQSLVYWEAYHQNKLWLKVVINYKDWTLVETNIQSSAEFILKVLKNIQALSDSRFNDSRSYKLTTNLQFPANYGLGSSSTLMANLGEWANVDPFHLNTISLGGSGYDIAVAKTGSAILYKNKPKISFEKINFQPAFKDELLFIHLNKKQNTREGINQYKTKPKSEKLIAEISEITKNVIKCNELHNFSELMIRHEQIISDFIEIPKVRSLYFDDCPTFVKSLGAWGGDFVMSAKFEGYKNYFLNKGFSTFFDWGDLIV